MCRILITLLLLQSALLSVFSQKDTEFWFVIPAVTRNHCGVCAGDAPVSFVFTTFELDANVTIEFPANSSIASIDTFIPANSVLRLLLWGDNFLTTPAENTLRNALRNEVPAGALRTPMNKGIHIMSSNYITAYYIVEEPNNSDIFALKGKNAIGNKFYVPFQRNQENVNHSPEQAYSAIDIVAVEDGTEVWIYPTDSVRGWGKRDSFMIPLDKGQTYSVVPGTYAGAYNRAANRHLSGTKVVATKGKIVVNMKDDSVRGDSGCYDLIGDQMIPVEAVYDGSSRPVIGSDYVIMKGSLNEGAGNRDRVYIVATEDNTTINITNISAGTSVPPFTLNERQQYTYTVPPGGFVIKVSSGDINKPLYVLHVTGAAGCEIGGAILPSISRCTGSFKVGFIRDVPPATAKDFYLNILARDGALSYFLLNGVPMALDTTQFIKIPGTAWWAGRFQRNAIVPLQSYLIENTRDIFHLGTLHGGSSNGGNYGYFSNYAVVEALSYVEGDVAQPNAKICYGDSRQLVADGGMSYEWIPSTYLSNPLIATPLCTPLMSIKYKVVVKGASCAVPDTASVDVIVSDPISASFAIEDPIGCAPFAAKFDNQSFGASKFRWYFTTDTVQSYAKEPGSYTFYNTTDSAITYRVSLYAQNKICTKSFARDIMVYPQINAGFNADTFRGCDPLELQFTDLSSGNLSKFFWEFGDGNGILDTLPTYTYSVNHTYTNRGKNDTTFRTWQIVESPFLCRDSAALDITVHPYIDVNFGADTVTRCSPFTININNSSVGAASYFMDFGDGGDTTMFAFNKIYHTYVNTDTVIRSDDLVLIGTSTQGCRDTFQRLITVFPEIQSQFTISDDEICDSVWINFTDLSYGHDYSYFWDFGDGNTSVLHSPSHLYRNTLPNDTTYTVSLKLESPFCTDISTDVVNVHPIVNAGFTYSITQPCTPMEVRIDPGNTTGDSLYWDFNGDNVIDSLTLNQDPFTKLFYNSSPSANIIQNIKLRASNYGCSDNLSRSLTIWPQVVSDIVNVSTVYGCNPVVTTFGNNSRGGNLDYNWFFDDATSSSDSIPAAHTFNNTSKNQRVYNVKLHALHPVTLCSSSDSVQVTVEPLVTAGFTLGTTEVCTPFNATFINTSTKATNEAYEWDFGDGNTSTTMNNFHQYNNNSINTINKHQIELRSYLTTNPACESFYYDSITVFPRVFASYSPGTLTGCYPLNVNFTNNSRGYNNGYHWDFDDGTTSSLLNPSKEFLNNGTTNLIYNVNLTVTDGQNCQDDTTIQIVSNPEVVSAYTLLKLDECTPINVQFNPVNSKGNRFLWDYNGDNTDDETRINSNIFTRSYNNLLPNSNSVLNPRLITYYDFAPACRDTVQNSLTIPPRVIASFTPSALAGCQPLNINFSNGSTGGTLNYDWDFGDAASSSLLNPQHIYNNFSSIDNTIPVTLTATADNSCNDDTTVYITVYSFVESDFKVAEASKCSPFAISITNSSRGGITQYNWDFGDGTTSVLQSPAHTYHNTTGLLQTRTINLQVRNSHNCTHTSSDIVSVYPQVNPDFDVTIEGCHPFTAQFSNSTQYATDYDWKFGDGSSSEQANPIHIYYNFDRYVDSTYNVLLTALSEYECVSVKDTNISVHPKPLALFNMNNTAGCPPFNAIFTNYSNGSNLTYQWSFGDGTAGTGLNQNHSYTNSTSEVQDYMVNLYAISAFGCRDTIQKELSVYPEVRSSFTQDINQGCSPLEVSFTNTSENQDYVEWDFDDGIYSSVSNAEHRFVNNGSTDRQYAVKLTSRSDYNCYSVSTYNTTVYPTPVVEFTVLPTHQMFEPNPHVDITNWSNHLDTWQFTWDFGDGSGSNSNEEDFSREYTIWGPNSNNNEIPITLSAVNLNHPQCKSQKSHSVRIIPPLPEIAITGEDPKGCVPFEVDFATAYKYVYNEGFEWDFDDGATSNQANTTHTFTEPGIYNVKLLVEGDGGYNYDYQTVEVYRLPEVDFEVAPDLVMLPAMNEEPEPIQCYNLSKYGESYLWEFGDGQSSESKEPSHIYIPVNMTTRPPYYYDVKLSVWSEYGCVDSLIKVNAVEVDGSGLIEFPNAFTPNITGPIGPKYTDMKDNRIFHPYHYGVETYRLEIYTRWGELIFATMDINEGWDGYIKEKLAVQGVYVWKAWATYTNGREFLECGDVTLLHNADANSGEQYEN